MYWLVGLWVILHGVVEGMVLELLPGLYGLYVQDFVF